MVPRIFEGQRAFVVASGPSLRRVAPKELRAHHVLAVNLAFEYVPFADAMYFSDFRFWDWYGERVLKFPGMIFTGDPTKRIKSERIRQLELSGMHGLDMTPGVLRHGNNSGYAAINLACQMGAKRIVLVGFDMKPEMEQMQRGFKITDCGERQHFHAEHPIPTRSRVYQKMLPHYAKLPPLLAEIGVEVVNANPDSAIEAFPKVRLDDEIRVPFHPAT